MSDTEIRNFGKLRPIVDMPALSRIQRESYDRFSQMDAAPDKRQPVGLEGLLREIFPIVSYDGNIQLEYLDYELGKPRYSPDECRQLRLTYGVPFRIRCRLIRKEHEEIMEDSIYLGELPIMIGGGEFIINGAERVIVSQLHRSPGVDFVVESQEGDRPLHACRIIPERGSWIEMNVTKKDVLVVRIDQSSKISATTFLRAMDERFSDTETLIREFYPTKQIAVDKLKEEMWVVADVIDKETGEELVKAGCQIGEHLQRIQESSLKKVEVCEKIKDIIIMNTLAEDASEDHEGAVQKIYARLRPGNPVKLDKAQTFFREKFYDDNRYRLGRVGRFRLNRKFKQDISETEMTLRPEDFLNSMKYILQLRSGEGFIDDIDHLGNRRLRTIDELAADEMRKGFLKLRRSVQERMSIKDIDQLSRIAELVNSKSITSSIEFFFGRGELSQVVDQTNPLSQLTHERRLSALGPGGLNRKRAGFEVRDVHISHYGRICPIETPEGTNIGLISSLSIYASVDEYGFLVTPYGRVEGGQINDMAYLRADEEIEAVLAPLDVVLEGNQIVKGMVLARLEGDLSQIESTQVEYVDVSTSQTVGVSASLIPFLEHDDANRALMGSNMQRQAVPLLKTEAPIIATGMEKKVAENSSMVVKARQNGTVTFVDAGRIVLNEADEYVLRKFVGLNERTCLNQKPIVALGQKVKKDDIIADGAATYQGELALGRNVLVGFMMFDGYNFEDAILISEKLVKADTFTSIHIESYDIECRETKLGREEFTRDIPNVSEKALANLDEGGVVRIGTRVRPGDILVGKVSPKSKSELSPEEKLLYAIFGRAGEDVKNDSLEVPSGQEGIVIDAKRFSRRMYMSDKQRQFHAQSMKEYGDNMTKKVVGIFRQMSQAVAEEIDMVPVDPATKQKMGVSTNHEIIMEQVESFSSSWIKDEDLRKKAQKVIDPYWQHIQDLLEEKKRKLQQMKRGDELPSGVLEMVKIYIATKRQLAVGDKMAGRHGNKGVIARILPEEDMPFLADGTPLDVLLNPLGVPGRMNVGQILETHLGWAAKILGFQAINPVFDGAHEQQIHDVVEEANQSVQESIQYYEENKLPPQTDRLYVKMPYEGKVALHDGRTGEPFEQKVTVGYMYLMKLHHLVDDKIHARATGPYSLITQQPLGGKARTGGQRFGEMEVWGLEAYGTAYILQELLTVKSDDVEGRTKIYESMVKGTNMLEAGTPVSFDVLCNEIRGLGLNIQLEKKRI
ncbi:MAG: DNA-directed RNA polymerase subunit beta [Sedimentisphaerales bacterium]|nr:DNA-directed RNA polymerase subunit beta [Sedimentisphaerales bacterium]